VGSGNGADPEFGTGIGTAAIPAGAGSGIGALLEPGIGAGTIDAASAAAGVGTKPAGIEGAGLIPATFVGSEAAVGASATLISPERGTAGAAGSLLAAGAGRAGLGGELGAAFVDVVDARAAFEAALRVPSTVISICPLLFRKTKS
jgi:hypothetical protein